MAENKKKKSNVKSIIVAIFLVALVLFYFNHLSDQSSQKKTQKELTELQELCEYNMIDSYPKTPRDLVKLHCRYYKVFFGQDVDDDELAELNKKIRNLYSEELLVYNSESGMLIGLKNSIKNMNAEGYSYKNYELPEASQIVYYTVNGKERATLEVKQTVDIGDTIGYLNIQYVLQKEGEQWKILAWGESTLDKTIEE
ncbi:MAG: DUF6715 family protein [Wujia sp.]